MLGHTEGPSLGLSAPPATPVREVRHRPEAFRSPGRLSASALCSLPMAPAAKGQRGRGRGEWGDPAGPQIREEARREGTPRLAFLRGALTEGSRHRRGYGRDRRAALLSFTGSVASARSFRDADWPRGRRKAFSSGFEGPASKPERRGGAGDARWRLGRRCLKGPGFPKVKDDQKIKPFPTVCSMCEQHMLRTVMLVIFKQFYKMGLIFVFETKFTL